ncbi:MAG: hypothetical protein OER22_16090, partial [Gammaproteobacteria bacterium]|nr:hypothetical protein [Gammaproteobacteria bacterium]
MNSRKAIALLIGVVTTGGCTLLQPPAEDPAMVRLAELERRLDAIERIVNNQGLVQLTQQVDALERRTDQLQGKAETLRHDAEDTAVRQRQLYADL